MRNRKYLTKEVKFTLVSMIKTEIVNGKLKVTTVDEYELLDILDIDKAQNRVNKLFGKNTCMVREIKRHYSRFYELSIEDIIKYGSERGEKEHEI